MSETSGARGVIVAHGTLAQGLADAATIISGVGEGVLFPVSNAGRSPQALQESIDQHLAAGRVIVFTDLPSGSCAVAARKSCRGEGRKAVVCGVNLPMLLDFVFNRHLPFDELVPRLLSKGIGSIISVPDYH